MPNGAYFNLKGNSCELNLCFHYVSVQDSYNYIPSVLEIDKLY